ncbi:SpoVG family protein [Candidatus Laterigemmans baculatus]|uniref:SpoVG family protein n=1 Tax=Candidatus Laterigemmans baculatus TaxID=2770505 RepID=UPI0013DB749E|nr:SpoVG family protein [Candidatus Laterigemmans baculatus]
MEITEVRIKLMEASEDRLRAFCSITFDHCFVVRDLKIIDGVHGPFVAMPSRKLTGHCPRCGHKNHLRSLYCNQCGVKLRASADADAESPQKLYADVAHPINSSCREMIQKAVIEELDRELARAGEPGYRSRYDDEFSGSDAGPESEGDESLEQPPTAAPPRPHFDRGAAADAKRDSSSGAAGRSDSANRDEDDSFGAGIF